ncbi:hypothetical protein [Enterococcus plantarum]|uniref:hypothetical protein n=1 Tax=Enterococcus plantarum TaxID=1077675 RepID=UPI001A8C03C8|nr:hypothetical protein [Enterococcus plantarum]MBO0423419.1 hypothetical protein [Enterococcus plantarum]
MEVVKNVSYSTVILLCPNDMKQKRISIKVLNENKVLPFVERIESDFIAEARSNWKSGFKFEKSSSLSIIKSISDPDLFFEIRVIDNFDFWAEGAIEELY